MGTGADSGVESGAAVPSSSSLPFFTVLPGRILRKKAELSQVMVKVLEFSLMLNVKENIVLPEN